MFVLKEDWTAFVSKTLLIIIVLCLTASCTRVRNKVVDWLRTSSNFKEYHVSQLYPSLGQDGDCGVCEEWPLYNMWFRYQGTPAQVESAIIAKDCTYTEITPDSAFISCDRNYILEKQRSHQRIDFFDEWETLPEDHLLYYHCCRTPHQHFFVFDTVSGYVYHHMVEFRE